MHITYEELLELIKWGLFNKPMKGVQINWPDLKSIVPIANAAHKGKYVGSPGKDIFFALPYLSDSQMKEVAERLCEEFPVIPPYNHLNVGSCIRFIYGQFKKQGTLRSKRDFRRMKKEMNNDKIDWSLPRKFLGYLSDEFKKNKNYYGLCILYEMEGHRLGDEAVLCKDKRKLKKMEKKYLKSVDYAFKCNSYKHMFTPYFWCAKYFAKYKNRGKAVYYFKEMINSIMKNKNDPRFLYTDKIIEAFIYLNRIDGNWKQFYKLCKKSKDKCIRRATVLFSNLDSHNIFKKWKKFYG